MHDIVRQVVESAYIWSLFIVDYLFDTSVDRSLPRTDSIMPELHVVFFGDRVLHKVEENDTLTLAEIHLVYLDWWEHALKHQTYDFVRVGFFTATEAIHDEQRWRLEGMRENFGVSFDPLLMGYHIFAQ